MVGETVEYKFSVLNTIECRPQPKSTLPSGGRFMICTVMGDPQPVTFHDIYSIEGDILVLSGERALWIKTKPIGAKATVSLVRRGAHYVPRGYDLKVKVV